MSWYLRSLADGDMHRGQYSTVTRSVHAQCGIDFVPRPIGLQGDRLALPGWPPDEAQIRATCRDGRHQDV